MTTTEKISVIKAYLNRRKDGGKFISFNENESIITFKYPVDTKTLTNKTKNGKTIWFEKKTGRYWVETKTHVIFHFCEVDGWYIDPQTRSERRMY